MSEYMALLILISTLVSFAELISYSGGEEKSEKLAVSVVLVYCIISPIVPLVQSLDFDFSESELDGENLSGGAYLEVGEASFREGIALAVAEKWGLEKEELVVVVFGFDFETMTAEKIIITLLSGGITVDYREIEAYLEKSGIGECEVKYALE